MLPARPVPLIAIFALCGASSGCLYIGGYNEEPQLSSVTLQASPADCVAADDIASSARFAKKDVTLCANAFDDERLNFSWRVTLVDIDGASWAYPSFNQPVQSLASLAEPPSWETVDAHTTFALARLGDYTVEVTATDPDGAATTYKRTFEVDNHPAQVIARFEPQNVGAALGDGAYPGHAEYHVVLDGSDDDEPLDCGEGKTKVEYIADAATKALFSRWEVLPCKALGTRLDVLALRGDPSKFADKKTIVIRALITDKRGLASDPEEKGTELYIDLDTKRRLELHPNRPPCLLTTGYGEASQRLLLGDGGERKLGERAIAQDDVLEAPLFRWGVARTRAGPYDTIGSDGQTLTVPPDYAPPGQRRYFRVQIDDGIAAAPSTSECKDDDWACLQGDASGRLFDNCYRWLTWEVEFR